MPALGPRIAGKRLCEARGASHADPPCIWPTGANLFTDHHSRIRTGTAVETLKIYPMLKTTPASRTKCDLPRRFDRAQDDDQHDPLLPNERDAAAGTVFLKEFDQEQEARRIDDFERILGIRAVGLASTRSAAKEPFGAISAAECGIRLLRTGAPREPVAALGISSSDRGFANGAGRRTG